MAPGGSAINLQATDTGGGLCSDVDRIYSIELAASSAELTPHSGRQSSSAWMCLSPCADILQNVCERTLSIRDLNSLTVCSFQNSLQFTHS